MATETAVIQLKIDGAQAARETMERMDKLLKTVEGRHTIRLSAEKAQKEMITLEASMKRLRRIRDNAEKGGDLQKAASRKLKYQKQAYDQLTNAVKIYNRAVKQADKADRADAKEAKAKARAKEQEAKATERAAKTEAKAREKEAKAAEKAAKAEAKLAAEADKLAAKEAKLYSFSNIFGTISSRVGHAGSAMQSLGNALTRLSSPFRRFTTGLLYGIGYKALNLFTEGFSGAFERYDTMKNYSKSLEALGLDVNKKFVVGTGEAKTALENLNDAVLGLPTGLDEIVASQKVYAGATGEMVKSTKVAIAANNAFLASSTKAREQRVIQRYLSALASGAELTANQWASMRRNMPLVMREVSNEMKYADFDKFNDDLQKGKVAVDDFLDAFVKVGTEGKVQAAANVMKTTWEGLTANIQNAAKRMGEGILKALDTAFESYNGRNLVQNLLGFDAEGNEVGGGVKDFINGISESIQDWVKANPDKILEFFETIKSIDWKSFLKGFADGMLEMARAIKWFADTIGGSDLSWIGKWAMRTRIAGGAFTIFGGLLKGTRHIWGALGATAFIGIKAAKKGGIGGLLSSMLLGNNPAKTVKAMEATEKVAPSVGKFSSGLSKIFVGWAEIAAMVGGTALVGWGSVKALKGIIKDCGEIADLVKQVDWQTAAPALEYFGAFIAGFMTLGSILGQAGTPAMLAAFKGTAVLGGLTTFVAGVADLDMFLIKDTFRQLKEATDFMGEAIDNIKGLAKIKNVPQIKKNIQQAIAVFNSVSDLLQISRNNPVTGEGTNGLNELDEKSANTIKNVADAVKNMKESVDTLNKLGTTKMKLGGLAAVMAGMRNAFAQLGSLLNDMPPVFKDNTASSWAETMNGTMTNLKSVFDSLVGKGGILKRMPKLVQQMAELDKGNVFVDLKPRMEQLGAVLTDVYNSLQGIGAGEYFASNIDHFRSGLKSLKFAIKHLQEISGMEVDNTMVTKVQTIIKDINKAFDQDEIATLTTTIDTFKQSIEDALATFEALNEDIEITPKVKLGSGFQSSVDSVTKEIRGANGKVSHAVDDIQTDYSKRIRVHLAFEAIISGIGAVKDAVDNAYKNVKGAKPETESTGGLIYRSKGGSVNWKPRGTDKIPAMLTEGEYVQRKQAVDLFGVNFMRKVNSLDIKGAMDELLTRAGTSVGIGRQSVFNSTVNNNQRIIQNINTNNPNFANVRMGRFVGAL